ncbi:MAG: serine/threonine-protein kinase, partial [Phycisphaerales bacterium]
MKRPYFVMEFIDGLPLDQYIKRDAPDLRSRLELIARVSDAVQYAHQKGVIHRDLKPANILIMDAPPTTSHDTRPSDTIGLPKILDFGVARLTDDDSAANTLHTQPGQLIGTLAYMSPEQVSSTGADIDTRCDVYALGVIAFEVLTGRLPLDLAGKTVPDIALAIRDTAPKRAGQLLPELRGEVETILSKALEKDRDQRYSSAAELAADLRRYLRDEPIIARAPTAMYQLRKFAKRNRAIVVAGCIAMLALVGGLFGVSLALIEARHQRDTAQAAENVASDALRDVRDIAAFQGAILENIDVEEVGRAIHSQIIDGTLGSVASDGNITLDHLFQAVNPTDLARRVLHDSILASASDSVETAFADRPLVAARIRHSLTQTYISLGMPELALEQADKAYRTLASQLGDSDPETVEALMSRAYVLHDLKRLDLAETDYARALAIRLATPGTRPELIADARRLLGSVIASRGRFDEAEAQLTQSIAEFDAAGVSDFVTVQAINALADVYRKTERPEEARRLLADAISLASELPDDDQWLTLQLSNNLGMLNIHLGYYNEAIATFRELIPIVRSKYGNEDPRSL